MLCYNIIELFRYAIAVHKKFLIQLEDLLYWIFCLFLVFHVALTHTKGQIRFFFVFGILLGMVLCKATISPILLFFSEKIIDLAKKIISLFFEILFTPFMLIYVVFCPPIRNFHLFCERIVSYLLKKLKFYVTLLFRRISLDEKIWRQVKLRKKARKGERFGGKKK